MLGPTEEQFLELHEEYGLKVYDLAKVFRMSMREAELTLRRAKEYEARGEDRLLAAIQS